MNAEEREMLKDQVMEMILTGYTQRAISKQLGISLKTIVTYVKSRKKESYKEMMGTANMQIAEMELSKKKRTQKLWTIVLDDTQRVGDRTKAIQLLQNEEVLAIKRKQIVGLLPAEAPLVAIQNNNVIEGPSKVEDIVKRRCPELLERFSQNKVKLLTEKEEVIIEVEPVKEVNPWNEIEAKSSNILKYSFNELKSRIRIWFKSSAKVFYEYDCSTEVFSNLQKAQSVGSYISYAFKNSKFDKVCEES